MVKTIYFWQNIPSPHQVPYQRELAEMGYRVVLVVDLEMLPNRTKMGWEVGSIQSIADSYRYRTFFGTSQT